ncbi:hypothetical protein M8J75_009008 [Diaphorina citri]|nr:hypothetical protein M8J75_009008 [Diaphorina citri]
MPALPTPSQVAGRHLPLFEAYYKELDPKNTNNIGALNAAKFLKNSGLPDALLSKIWDLSDPNATGFLTKAGLFVSLKLVALAQNNLDVSMANIEKDVPPPMMGDATVFPPNIPTAPSPLPVISSIPVVPVDWSMTPMERLKYETLFESLQPQNGFIPGNKVKGVLMDSKLPTDTLGKIWDLADMDKDGCLDRHEFIVAMHLVYKALEKFAIPATLPPELLPPAKRKALEHNKVGPPPLVPPPPAVAVPAPAPWVVSAEDQARYEAMFVKADADQDGFVNGPEIKHVFLSCNLAQSVLANIWSLADMNQVGKLNKEQFCLAMWLVQQALKGHDLPSSLTPEMVPPSMRGPGAPSAAPAAPPPPPSNPEMDMISRDIAELSAERTALENEIAGKQADIHIRSGEIKSLQGELDALAATLRQLENQKVEAAKRLADLKLQSGDVESELKEVNREIEAEETQVDKLRTQATDQETLLSRQEEELHSKKKELDSLKHEEHELEKKQKELNKKVNHLSDGLQETQLLISQVKSKVSSLEELQRAMNQLISISEEAASSNDVSTVPESLLSLEPEFKQDSYTRLIHDNSNPTANAFPTDAFASTNGFSSDPFASTNTQVRNSTAGNVATSDSRFTKDPFGCDPFSAGGAPPSAASSLGAPGHGGPPPRPESPSPALPPKKSKQPPPRPAPPRPAGITQPVPASGGSGQTVPEFADFDNFNTKAASTLLSSPFSTSSAYSSAGSLSPHSSIKSPTGASVIGRPTSRSGSRTPGVITSSSFNSLSGAGGNGPTAGSSFAAGSGSNSFATGGPAGSASSSFAGPPPLTDFADDPFKDYRYEDPFNFVDPFSDDDVRSAGTPTGLPVRTNPDGSPGFNPFTEAAPSVSSVGDGRTSAVPPDDMFSNDPFFSASALSQSSNTNNQSSTNASKRERSAVGASFSDPFFSPSASGANGDPFRSNNGFGDPFSFSTNNQSASVVNKFSDESFSPNKFGDSFSSSGSANSGNKFADDNFSAMFSSSIFDSEKPSSTDGKFKSNGNVGLSSTSGKPLTGSTTTSNGTGTAGKPSIGSTSNGGLGTTLPSESEQLAWAAVESLKLETEAQRKADQEKADLELALKLSQQGDSFPVKW